MESLDNGYKVGLSQVFHIQVIDVANAMMHLSVNDERLVVKVVTFKVLHSIRLEG